MAASEHELLLARLAVHYKILDEAAARQAVSRYRDEGGALTFSEFLVAEGIVDSGMLAKLEKAREVYLARKTGGTATPTEAAPPNAPAPVPAVPDPTDQVPTEQTPAGPTPAGPTPAGPTPAEPTPAPMDANPLASPAGSAVGEASLEDLLRDAVAKGASDLHVHSGALLRLRLDGALVEVGEYEVTAAEAEVLVDGLLNDDQKRQLREDHQLDLVYEIPGVARFRGNVYQQQRGVDAVFRTIPFEVPSFEALSLPEHVGDLAAFHQGLVLFTGPSGCGKSSTMAAVIDRIAQERREHILTIEDPVEFLFSRGEALVNQRHVGPHTESFGRALRAALREDPDVIVIGELRDLESVSLALTAAETGHLVLATLHTTGALRTINRLLGVFPPEEQPQVRAMLSESLRAIVSQHLVPKIGGGRIPALEILINTPAIANLIRDQKVFQVRSVMQTSSGSGMCLMDATLTGMVRAGTVTAETARAFADDPDKLKTGP